METYLRRIVITGLAALAVGLGTWVALPGAQASLGAGTPAASPSPVSHVLAGDAGKLSARTAASPKMAVSPQLAVAPAATVAANNVLAAVSCKHAGDCLAVGGNGNGGGGHGSPLAYLWNGSAWRATTVHLPSGATAAFLEGVACKSDGCIAVGYYRKSNHDYPLSMFWTGNSWTLGAHQPALPSGGANDFPLWVSCAGTVKSCVTVGQYVPTSNSNDSVAFAEFWNGSSWKVSKPPTPTTPWSILDTVSCVSATYCLAGGSYVAGSGEPLLADLWTGSSWHQVSVAQPTPQSGWFNNIEALSCSSTTNCTAVGDIIQVQSNNTLTLHTFAEVHTASGWSLTSVPMPSGQQGFLKGMSCVSATYCLAVGGVGPYTSTDNQGHAASAVWNGSAWTVKVVTPPSGQGSLFAGTECLSAANCVAVGTVGKFATNTGHGMTGFWNGTTWKIINTA